MCCRPTSLRRLASSLRFAAFRFTLLRTRPFSPRRVFPSRRARLRCFVFRRFRFLSLAAQTGVALGLDSTLWASASSGLGTGVAFGPRLKTRPRSAPVVSFVRWAFAPLRWRCLGKGASPTGAGGGAVPQVGGLSPCVRVRLHGDGPGAMFTVSLIALGQGT